eukprot:TRINITY_DN15377_c0_g1_i2.p1 TRINITY_DN15377_c0_g1~~TRINITY_DN15377_c0_g1_i2.p1  ORF type:complete len:178 (-),score=20.71 TRINITY_DN15377_c0_g1_i2:368-901(-)
MHSSSNQCNHKLVCFKNWAFDKREAGLDIYLVTNDHIRVPGTKCSVIRTLANDRRHLLQRCVKEVESRGIESVTSLDNGGKAKCSLPTGTVALACDSKPLWHQFQKQHFYLSWLTIATTTATRALIASFWKWNLGKWMIRRLLGKRMMVSRSKFQIDHRFSEAFPATKWMITGPHWH